MHGVADDQKVYGGLTDVLLDLLLLVVVAEDDGEEGRAQLAQLIFIHRTVKPALLDVCFPRAVVFFGLGQCALEVEVEDFVAEAVSAVEEADLTHVVLDDTLVRIAQRHLDILSAVGEGQERFADGGNRFRLDRILNI